MNRRCPECGSTNVRRSGRLESEATAYPFQSPYRCRDCELRFWVVSRRTLYGAVIGGVLFVTVVFLWSGLHVVSRPDGASPTVPASAAFELRSEASAPSADARVLGDTLLRQWGTQLDVPNRTARP